MDAFVRAVEWLRLLLVHVPGLAPLAAAPYLFRPLLMVLALGAAGAVVGVLVNLRCAEFHAEALVHAVFPGIVVGAVYRGIEAIIPAAAVAGVAAAAPWRASPVCSVCEPASGSSCCVNVGGLKSSSLIKLPHRQYSHRLLVDITRVSR